MAEGTLGLKGSSITAGPPSQTGPPSLKCCPIPEPEGSHHSVPHVHGHLLWAERGLRASLCVLSPSSVMG